jgi:diguanylate cyclase (GGDEF)-like protein/PAS domain S-box-containing protein
MTKRESAVPDYSLQDHNRQTVAESREWYRTIAEDIPALVVRVSPEYRVTFANDAYSAFMGKSIELIKGNPLSDFVPPENYRQVIDHFLSLNPFNPIASHEHINITHDGQKRWFRWTNRAFFEADGNIREYLCIGEDITESKEAFQMLKESETLKSSIIKASPDLIVMLDGEGRYLDILSGKNSIYSLPREMIIGKKTDEIFPEAVSKKANEAIRLALETSEMKTVSLDLSTPEGEKNFESRVVANGKNRVVAFIRDVTEQKRFEKQLRESEERYRDILDNIEEAYYEVDLFGRFTFFNNATCRMLGYNRHELKGMSYTEIYKDPEQVFRTFNRVFTTGEPDRGFTLDLVRKDGSTGYGELSVSLVRDKNGNATGFRGLARDITERVLFQEKLTYMSMHDQLTGLHNRAYFEEEIARLSRSRSYPVTLISADLDDLKLVNDSLGHDAGDKLLKAAAEVMKKSVRQEDILARVGGDEFTAILPSTDGITAEVVAARIRVNIEKYNCSNADLPLGLSIGVATTLSKEKSLVDVFKQADDNMYHDKLYRNNRVRNKTVEALMMALAERDYITEGHAQRLSNICLKIGEKIRLSSRQLSDLALLTQVHDLGKVGIPDKILFKEGSLTDEEWSIMRLHPEKGYRIAVTSPDLSPVADLILKHHERWDGSGYPLGLSGEKIPVECRILAIVDAFDAMTNDRPYSRARSDQEAIAEIKKCAGTQFDPALVEIFLSLF